MDSLCKVSLVQWKMLSLMSSSLTLTQKRIIASRLLAHHFDVCSRSVQRRWFFFKQTGVSGRTFIVCRIHFSNFYVNPISSCCFGRKSLTLAYSMPILDSQAFQNIWTLEVIAVE